MVGWSTWLCEENEMGKEIDGARTVDPSGYLSRHACEEFLVQLYFGAGRNYLQMCIDRAYLDFNRTLHGFGSHVRAVEVRGSASETLIKRIASLQKTKSCTQVAFDRWHKLACGELREHFRNAGFRSFTFGQAQKWVNMTIKYAFVMGDDRVPGLGDVLRFAHVPIDNIVLSAWAERGLPGLKVAWSRLDDYDEYTKLQAWIRSNFFPRTPLEAEFGDWLESRKPSELISGAH